MNYLIQFFQQIVDLGTVIIPIEYVKKSRLRSLSPGEK